MRIELPNGFMDGVDLFNFAEIDELRGKHQNYLADQKLVGNIGHVPKLLGDVVLSFQTEQGLAWKGDIAEEGIWKLPNGDIETILIKLRENTYGIRFYHEAICSFCGHHHKNLRVDLDTLLIDKMTNEERFASKVIELPKTKFKVELKPFYLKDMFEMLKITQNKQDAIITSALKLMIKTIDQKEPTQKQIDDLPVTDVAFLNDSAESIKLEGTIDTTLEIDCVNCDKNFKVKLNPVRPDFFSPTGGSMSLNI